METKQVPQHPEIKTDETETEKNETATSDDETESATSKDSLETVDERVAAIPTISLSPNRARSIMT